MSRRPGKETLVLSLAPTSRGLGFAVMEGPQRLIDWGVKSTKAKENAQCIARAKELIRHYQPDVIVLEDCQGSRRGARVQQLIRSILRLSKEKKIPARCFSRRKIQQSFPTADATTKREIAFAIVEQLPELAPQFPPRRQPWMTEDHRMTIFDAVSLTLAFFHSRNKRKGAALQTKGTKS